MIFSGLYLIVSVSYAVIYYSVFINHTNKNAKYSQECYFCEYMLEKY